MDVSENNGTPKSSILIGFSIINHPFWGIPTFGNTHMTLREQANDLQDEGFFTVFVGSVLRWISSSHFRHG